MSSSAPFANDDAACGNAQQTSGRRKYESQNKPSDTPFATDYAETREDLEGGTPGKRGGGRRRFDAHDSQNAAPFATGNGATMFEAPPSKKDSPPPPKANDPWDDAQTGRQKQIKPTDNSSVFRYDANDAANDTPTKGGRKRYDQTSQRSEAPFAIFGGDDTRFKDSSRNQPNSGSSSEHDVAGLRKDGRGQPPPNSAGEGMHNKSKMNNCPFALN